MRDKETERGKEREGWTERHRERELERGEALMRYRERQSELLL